MKKIFLRFALVGLVALSIAATIQKMSNVLIMGDSISIGYTPFLQKGLLPFVNVEHIPGNGGNTKRGIERAEQWLGTKQWDVIVFNFGLHDLARIDSLKKYNVIDGKQAVSIEEYKRNLTTIVEKLKETTATIIFANTTVVPDNAAGRKVEDVAIYNAAAQEIMKKNGIKVIDLYTLSEKVHPENSKPGNVHYTEKGYELLAAPIIDAIKEAIK